MTHGNFFESTPLSQCPLLSLSGLVDPTFGPKQSCRGPFEGEERLGVKRIDMSPLLLWWLKCQYTLHLICDLHFVNNGMVLTSLSRLLSKE